MPFYAGQKLKASALGQQSSMASYSATANQTVSTSTDTLIKWDNAVSTTPLVTRVASGVGHYFVLNCSGLWAISTTARWYSVGASGTGEKSIHVKDSLGIWFHGQGGAALASGPVTQEISFTKWLSVNQEIHVEAWQSSGGSQTLEQNSGLHTPCIDLVCILQES